MPLLSAATAAHLGTATVSKLYVGSTSVWPPPVPPPPLTSALAGRTPTLAGALTGTVATPSLPPSGNALDWMVIGAASTTELATAAAAGANVGLIEVFWDQCQSVSGGAVDATAVLANIARVRTAGMRTCLRVSLQYLPTFVDTAAVKFAGKTKAGATSTHNPGNADGGNARDWVWSASTRALVTDFLDKLFAQLDWSQIDRVQLGGGPYGEVQYPNSDGTVWWGFSTPAQTGTDLAAGQTAAPAAGYVPNTGTTWDASDIAFEAWYTQSLTNWMLWLIARYRVHYAGPIWVMHPGSGLRKVSQTPTGSFALAYREQVAKGTDWDTQIAAYPDADVHPYSTWADAAHSWDPDPYSDVNDGNAAPWYHLLRIARARGRAGRIWGENTGNQTTTDLARLFTSGSVALGYRGLTWLNHTKLVAGGAQVSYAQLGAKITTANGSVGDYVRGINMSGGEFGSTLPGVYDTDYHYDGSGSFTYIAGRGHKVLRFPIKWERIQPTRNSALNSTEVTRILDRAGYAAAGGAQLLLDVHNFGRYHSGGTDLVLGATLPAADLVDLWTRMSTAFKGNAGIWGYDLMNEPHDLVAVPGSFSGTVRYNWASGVQGWTGDTATASNVSGQLRLTASLGSGSVNMRKDDAATVSGGSTPTGAVIRVKVTPVALPAGTWTVKSQWQNASFAWQSPTATVLTRVDTGATVAALTVGQAVYATSTFASITSPPNAFALQVDGSGATAGTVTVDFDDFSQGAVTGGSTPAQVWESAAQSCVTAIRGNSDTAWIVVEGHNWSGAATWPDEHPAAFITDATGKTLYGPHLYFDRDRSGDYPDTYAAEDTWAQTQGASGLASWAAWGLQRFIAWARANGVRGYLGEIGWPNNADTASWNAVGETLYDELDRVFMGAAYWAAGEWWGTGYNLSAYTGTPLDTAASPATVIEAHSGSAPPTVVAGTLAGSTPKPFGALTGTPAGGSSLTDVTGVSFTDSGGLTGTYHFYGAGLPSSGAGLVVHLHGDAAFEYLNPTSNYCLAGNRGMIAVAKAKGYALLVPKAPDTTGTVTWWEAGARNATWLSELLASIYTAKGINNTKVWLVGYSGGAQQLTQYFVPTYGKARIAGGGALVLGGGAAPIATPVGWDATFKAAFPMTWITGGQDNGTYSGDGYNALADATAGRNSYNSSGFTATLTSPAGVGHEIDGAFGPLLDDLLPALSGYSPPSRTPGTVRPTLVTSYLAVQSSNNTSATTTPSFTPSAGEVIVVKCFNPDLDSPNIDAVVGGGLTYATKIHEQFTGFAECWVFVAEVGPASPGAMTVSASWFGTTGRHGIVVERWSSGLVKGVPKQGGTISGSGAPSASITPDSASSVLTWLDVDWNATSGTATYRSSATQTQTSSMTTVRAYAAYQNSTGTGAQTVGLTAPSGQAWTLGCIELLPAP